MKRYIFFGLMAFLMSCSATYHLEKALQKNPEILDIKRDSTMKVITHWRDTTIPIELKIPLQLYTDTGKTSIEIKEVMEPVNQKPIYAYSSDSVARAKAWITDSRLFLETWSVLDTLIHYKDSIAAKQKEVLRLKEITQQTKAEIREKQSLVDRLQKWLIVIAGFILLLFTIWLLTQFIKKSKQ